MTRQEHLSWAGINLTLLIGLLSGVLTDNELLAVMSGICLIACLAIWGWVCGWRVRSPVMRQGPTQDDAATLAKVEETRKVKDALTELFHARLKQAVSQLRGITTAYADELEKRPDPYLTLGQLVQLHWVAHSERGEGNLRRVLEGVMWDWPEASASSRRFVYDMDVRRQEPSDLHWALYFYYVEYRILLAGTKRLARLLEVDLARDERFARWGKLDDELTSELRTILARSEMASLRTMLEDEDWLGRWR